MSVVIKVLCEDCGAVELSSPQVLLNVYEGEDFHEELAAMAYYEFECPTCYTHIEKPAPDGIRFLLVSAECPVRIIPYPLELLETHEGEPINFDDILAFHEELKNL